MDISCELSLVYGLLALIAVFVARLDYRRTARLDWLCVGFTALWWFCFVWSMLLNPCAFDSM